MRSHALRTRGWLCASLLFPLAIGCGGVRPDLGSVTGTVTYEGVPIEKGYVSFYPIVEKDGSSTGSSAGAPITQGHYQISNLAPGRKRVLVTAQGKAPENAQPQGRRSANAERRAKQRPTTAPEKPIPDRATGNNRIVEIKAGEQTLDLALTKPAPAKGGR